jgi:hypothetical protein
MKKPNGNIVIGYHFLRDDGTAHGGYIPAPVGEWEPEITNPECCLRGYHGSFRILDALRYGYGTILQRCEYRNPINDDMFSDKFASSSRRALVRADASNLLRMFAVRCADKALAMFPNKHNRKVANDILAVATAHALGRATYNELKDATRTNDMYSLPWKVRDIVCHACYPQARHAAMDAFQDLYWSVPPPQQSSIIEESEEWLESACLDLL